MTYCPKQGDIIWLNFDPTKGVEKGKNRPALVVSNDHIQNNSKFAIVVPITHGKWEFATHIQLPNNSGLKSNGTLHLEQIRSIDYTAREIKFLEKIDNDTLGKVLNLLKLMFS